MGRVVRVHDRPYAIFEPFGARPGGSFDETEEFVLDSIAKVAEAPRALLVPLILVSLVMIVLWLGESPFIALLTSLIAEMYDQKVSFIETLKLHPRIHSVRGVVGLGALILGATGMVQPMYLLWSIGSLAWGTILVWMTGRELHGWKGWGNLMVPVGFVLYQALSLLVYFLIR